MTPEVHKELESLQREVRYLISILNDLDVRETIKLIDRILEMDARLNELGVSGALPEDVKVQLEKFRIA